MYIYNVPYTVACFVTLPFLYLSWWGRAAEKHFGSLL